MGKGSRSIRTSNKRNKKIKPGSAILAEPLSDITPENDYVALWEELADEHQSSLELVYGKKGLPDGVAPILDHLGHVIRKKDAVAATTKTVYDHKPEPVRRVTLLRDTTLEYPELYLDIFVQPDPGASNDEANYAAMFARTGSKRAKSIFEADVVVFSGGADVDPMYYHEERHNTTFPSSKRDETDIDLYMMCLENGIPMVGVCRGAQFLHVMNGGKLFQDVDGHYGNHGMWDVKSKTHIEKISSVHHQMVKDNQKGGMDILGTSSRSNKRWSNPKTMESGQIADIEAFFYRDTCCLGFQGHPEYSGYPKYTQWCLKMMNEYIILNPDVTFNGGQRRISTALLEERKELGASIIKNAVSKAKGTN